MQKFIISLICCLLPALTFADTLAIRDNAPDRYVVVKGDTLWDISAKFFKDPWNWPQIWGLNKDTIKNPHWIYPGDVVLLDRAAATLKVESGTAAPPKEESSATAQPPSQPENTEKQPEKVAERPANATRLSPKIRAEAGDRDAIPSIPLGDIEPFLRRPLVMEKGALDNAPVIVAGLEKRTLLSNSDIAFVKDLPANKGLVWQIYRPGKALVDPESNKVLGYEVDYLGDARVEKFGDISTLRIFGSKDVIYAGDHLTQSPSEFPDNFMPRAPSTAISARVMTIVNGITMAGQRSVVIINKGNRDGIQNGHVLALYRKGETVTSFGKRDIQLPNMRYGLLLVFRTFNNVSYALVMQTRLPVELMDVAQTP